MLPEFCQATIEHLSGTRDNQVVAHSEIEVHQISGQPDPRRRNTNFAISDSTAFSHRIVKKPIIIVKTTSEVDILDDGYRWRKYGEKHIKGHYFPRSYYKCATRGCNMQKHIERSSMDSKDVITIYKGGRHNHDVPTAISTSSHRNAKPIIVQTISEVDIIDDGYRWRKYGQQDNIKGHSFPRSYYKCTTPGCNIRKHIQRSWKDPKAVITTYKGGRHNHDVPAPKILPRIMLRR